MNEIDSMIVEAINLAKKRFGHEYVTLEHLTTVIMEDEIIRTMCMTSKQMDRVFRRL